MLNRLDRILVVAAHADDEAIGCGGLLMTHDGAKRVLVCSTMTTNQNLDRAGLLGNYTTCQLPWEDQKLDNKNQIELNRIVEEHIEEFRPDIILTHSIHDNNTDHQFVHKSVNVAARFIPNLLYFRIPSPGEFPGFDGRVSYKINWQEKEKLLKVYDAEMRPWPHPRSYKGLQTDTEYFEIGRLSL